MIFAWESQSPPKRSNEKRQAMYRKELEERAALLHRLGYSLKQCKSRLHAAVAWDFELNGRPKHAAEIDKIVDALFRRGGGTGSGAPPL